MNGIQGLMQAPGQPQGQPPQAPGQAAPPGQGQPPMPGMQPGAGGPQSGVQSLTPALAQMNKQQLLMEMMNPNSQIPKFALLSAIDQKVKQEKAMQAVQGSMAQGQNAQNQQQGSVAQSILQEAMQGAQQPPTQMARHGGLMHVYADGGAVAFQFGGAAQAFPVSSSPRSALEEYNEAKRQLVAATQSGDSRSVQIYLNKMQRLRDRIEPSLLAEAEQQTSIAQAPAVVAQQLEGPPPSVLPPIEDARRRSDIPPEGMVVAQPAPRADVTTKQRLPAVRPPGAAPQRPPAATSPFAGLASLVPKPDPELEAAFKSARDAAGPTAEQTRLLEEKQAAEMEGRRAAETGRSKRAEDERARTTRAYEEALSGQQGIFGPRGLLEIAAAIDPRRGQIMGSLARGAAGVMAREEKAKKEAKTEYDRAQQLYSQELNALDAIKLATLERDTAIAKGRVDEARAAEARRAQLQIDYNKLKDERFRAQQKFELDRAQAEATAAYQQRVAGASERQATAAETTAKKPAAEIQFMEYLKKPENFALKEKIESAKRADDRMVKLQEIFSKMTTLDRENMGVKNFDDFLRAVTPTKPGAAGPALGTKENPIKIPD